MKPKSQKQQIILLLLEGWTDPITAFRHAGTIKLSTRIGELRQHFTIQSREQIRKSKYGNRVRYFEYRILPGSNLKKSLAKYGLN